MNKYILFTLVGSVIALGIFFAVVNYKEPEFIQKCVKSHQEQRTGINPMYVGHSTIYIPYSYNVDVCDQYEKQKNPKYKG